MNDIKGIAFLDENGKDMLHPMYGRTQSDHCKEVNRKVAMGNTWKKGKKVADTSNCPVIISGGVSSIDDIKKAKNLNNKNIEGIIIGKAIYDGDIKLDKLAIEIDA